MFGNPPQLTNSPRDSVHCRRYHSVDCIESNLTISVVCPISNSFPQVFNLELEGEAVVGSAAGPPAAVAGSRFSGQALNTFESACKHRRG
jgi:hypothetical protein